MKNIFRIQDQPFVNQCHQFQRLTIASLPKKLPKILEKDLKKPSEFRLIGKSLPRLDVPSKVNGSAKYGIDVNLPGMVYATLMQSPMDGAKPDKVNIPEVKKVKGVFAVIPLPFGVAVIGKTLESTIAGREILEVTWNTKNATAAEFDSEKAKGTRLNIASGAGAIAVLNKANELLLLL